MKKTLIIGFWVLLALALATGCSSGSGNGDGGVMDTGTTGAGATQPVTATSTHGNLQATITAGPAGPGAAVPMSLTIRNTGNQTTTFNFNSGYQYDFEAAAQGGLVWRYSFGKAFTQALTSIRLNPGESFTKSTTWDRRDNAGNPVPLGSYAITGRITSSNLPITSHVVQLDLM